MVSIWAADIVEVGAAAIYVDNNGFVWVCQNGCSRDEYIYTLAKYIEVSYSIQGIENNLGHGCRHGGLSMIVPYWK